MTPAEKRELIEELAQNLGWLIRALSKAKYDFGRTWKMIHVEFFSVPAGYNGNFDAAFRPKDNLELREKVVSSGIAVGLSSLRYGFLTAELELDIPAGKELKLEWPDDFEALIDELLDTISQKTIRELFAEHEKRFFTITGTMPADWHMS